MLAQDDNINRSLCAKLILFSRVIISLYLPIIPPFIVYHKSTNIQRLRKQTNVNKRHFYRVSVHRTVTDSCTDVHSAFYIFLSTTT